MDVTDIPDPYDIVALREALKKVQTERDNLLDTVHKTGEGMGRSQPGLDIFTRIDDYESGEIFDSLELQISFWSRKEAIDLSQLADLQGHDRELFFKEVAKIVLLEEPDKQEFPKRLRSPRSLMTVLQALLTHHVFATIYTDPFFFFGEETSQILHDIMSLGSLWNLGVSQQWREDTLNLIFPQRNTPDQKMVKSETEKLLRKAAVSGAKKFMRSPAKYIIKGHPNTLQKLEDLYMHAAEHFYRLSSEPYMLKLLDASNFLGQPFDGRNKSMRPAERIYMLTDLDPTGQKIAMVDSPAILKYERIVADPGESEMRKWHKVEAYRRAYVWFPVPRPGDPVIDEKEYEPIPIPRLTFDESVPAIPPRSDLSPEALSERMIKRFDRVTLLDLVKPYLDDFAEQMRPVIEGLRGEIAQRNGKAKRRFQKQIPRGSSINRTPQTWDMI
ncbi:hypothetical protein EAE96_004540 [Botrytis aclada]|nr:hypothetical protein EAE96_004540 [Botrytis aclada]